MELAATFVELLLLLLLLLVATVRVAGVFWTGTAFVNGVVGSDVGTCPFVSAWARLISLSKGMADFVI